MDFLQLADKNVLVTGIANRKSVAFHIARLLREAGAQVIASVHTAARGEQLRGILPETPILVCDVADSAQIADLAKQVAQRFAPLHGLVHSIAYANYSGKARPFHETTREDFLQAVDVSCYSLISLSNALKESLAPDASVVTISISTTRMAAENYGFMAPAKAALDSTICFLAKSFSGFSKVRFNAVGPGLLKTSSSAGIPGYVDSYLYAERVIPRGRAVTAEESAAVACFLLSPRSSGINTQRIVVDAGMETNYFDRDLVRRALRPE